MKPNVINWEGERQNIELQWAAAGSVGLSMTTQFFSHFLSCSHSLLWLLSGKGPGSSDVVGSPFFILAAVSSPNKMKFYV